MTSPTPEPEEQEFNRQFMGLTNRSPTGEDIPTWSRIILTQDPPQGLLLNYYAYRRAAFQHVLTTQGLPSVHGTPDPTRPATPAATGRESPAEPLPTSTPLTPPARPPKANTGTEHLPTPPPPTTEHKLRPYSHKTTTSKS